jgi:hypothetical protein
MATHTSFRTRHARELAEGTAVFTAQSIRGRIRTANAGGGASLWGRTIVVESRVLAFTPENAPMARRCLGIGMNWY